MPKTILPRHWWLILACVVILSGCTSLKILPSGLPLPGQDDKPQQPASIVAVWSDMVLQQPNGPSARGFGGRLTFYTSKGVKPVKVEGTLVVYGFEEEGGVPNKVQPDKKFVFTPEQFTQHYEKTTLGHSYSIWIPWDAGGSPQKEVSLIARFTPANGQLVVGEQTRHCLPGPPNPDQPKMARAIGRRIGDQAVRPVSYETPGSAGGDRDGAGVPAASRMQISTIELSPALAEQMRSAPPLRMDRPTINLPPPAQQAVPTWPTSRQGMSPHGMPAAAWGRGPAFTATAESERPAEPRSGYSPPGPPRAQVGPTVRPGLDHGPTSPSLGGWPSGPASTPPAEPASGFGPASPARPTAPDSPSPAFAVGPRGAQG